MYALRKTASPFKQFKHYRWQAGLILWRQFTEPYRKTVLGAFWALLLPIIPIAAYVMLRLAIQTAAPDENGIHPVIYVSVGVTLWFLFRDMFMAPIVSVQKQAVLLAQTNFPVIAAIAVGTGRAIIDMLMRAVFCLPFLIIYAETGILQSGEALLLLSAGAILMLSIGVWLIPLWIVLPDIMQVLDVIFRFLIFFSLAIFPLSISGPARFIVDANPFAFLIENVRSLAFGLQTNVDLPIIGWIALASLVSLFSAAYVIGTLEYRIKEMIA